ncbi:MAG: hypothetical protein F6J93_25925 [Oscillatoria sp. SIO1A7]|nr:hypothetical protein [Oscillatoria sp. SIO1A7]
MGIWGLGDRNDQAQDMLGDLGTGGHGAMGAIAVLSFPEVSIGSAISSVEVPKKNPPATATGSN